MGHTSRVLYLSMSPDGENIVTGAGDETLRFWNLNNTKVVGTREKENGCRLNLALNLLR